MIWYNLVVSQPAENLAGGLKVYQRTNLSVLLVIFVFVTIFGACEIAPGKIIYVDEIAAGANDGSSWDDAYNFLQDALADANESEKPLEIRLAQGSYSPDKDTLNPEGTADRQATFQLINGIALKGGYAGLGTADPNTRDAALFETALVGDIRSTGFGGGNSYHIVTGSGTDETAVLDGLIIAGGNANGPRLGEKPNYDYRLRYGAGLYNDAGSPTLIDCVFIDNSAYMGGGGMYNSNGSSPNLTNCIFDWNSAVDGCGIYNSNSNPILTGCMFSTNIAQNNGGGMYNEQSNPILTDCVFTDNSASYGGGIYNIQSAPTLTDCSFIANTTLTIRSTDSSLSGGGGMYNDRSSPILSNCIFAENNAYASLSNLGGAMYNNDNSNPVLTDCLFSLNWAENYGGGIYNYQSSPTLTDCVFNGNWAEEYGGGMYNKQSNPMLTSCMFVWNWAAVITSYHGSYPSGAGMYNESSSPIFSACVLSGNYAEGDGAGMYNSDSSPELANCIIAGNWTADFGGGMYNQAGNPTLTNCTFFGNIAYEGSALACDSPQQKSPGNVEMTNCILWDGGNEIWNNDDSVITITYSNIRGSFPGRGNIDADPLFAQSGYWVDFYDPNIVVEPDDPNASWTDGDYHVKSEAGRWDPFSESWVQDDVTSPCIDAGDPNSPVAFEPAPNGDIINMGAFGGTTEASKSPSGLHAKYGGGTGEPNEPYLIYTAEHLNTIRTEHDWDKNFKLMDDIDLDPNLPGRKVFDEAIIGNFKGFFDGNGHRIMHLTIEGDGGLGLFSRLISEAEVRDLEVVDVNIAGRGCIGGLVGINGGHLVNCFASGTINGNVEEIGGLVGQNYGIVEMCHSTGTVSGNRSVGGLVGENLGYVMSCYSTSQVNGDSGIGGLVGANGTTLAIRGGPGMISDCYSTGQVSAVDGTVGGLVGYNAAGNLIRCYSTGSVVGNEDIGGLVGLNKDAVIQCFWDIQTSHQTISAGGIGKTSTEMRTAGTFLSWSACGNEGTWKIDEGNDYPALWWENKTGETIAVGASLSELLAGKGLKENPYLIYTGEELNYVGLFPCDWDKHFKLMADIDLSDFDGREGRPVFNIIGSGIRSRVGVPFTGIFDGNGHTIANFTYTLEGDVESILKEYVENVGLFGCIADANAQITNVGLIDPNVDGGTEWNVGCLAGCLKDGSITGCYVEGGNVKGGNNVGGLIGYNERGNIAKCNSTNTNNEADAHTGGLVGCNYGGIISTSYSSGSITARFGRVGGLVGLNDYSSIDTCYSTCTVNIVSSAGSDAGGLVGSNAGSSITSSYSTGMVTGNYFVGGLVGTEYKSSSITNFWDIETSGQTTSASGSGKTTAEMQMASTFLEAGWDFVDETDNGTDDIWWILEGRDYPRLWWEAE
jgi:hypothetical protein